MVVADLKLGSIILPRSESPQAVSRLAEFEWFHKIDTENDVVTPEIDDLLLRAQKLYQTVDDVIKGLQIPLQVGILEVLFKGTVIKKKQYELDEVSSMITDLEQKSPTIVDGAAKALDESATTQRAIEEFTTIKETLNVVRKLNADLGGFGLMRYFYTNLFVINSTEYDEVHRSLDGVAMYRYDLESKDRIALIVISGADDSDRVLKVFRGFNANPFVIPAGLPQVPSQAYSAIEAKLAELGQKQKKIDEQVAAMKKSLRRDILALHESAYLAKEVLESLRKPGGTKRFAVIQGYIPKNMESKFKDVTKQWMSVIEDVTDP
ncbi:MAG: ATPase, partial [Candidatus Nitrosotenuis sp.]|nr:ATPase [Candidatus Nitrosotenuis sp.]